MSPEDQEVLDLKSGMLTTSFPNGNRRGKKGLKYTCTSVELIQAQCVHSTTNVRNVCIVKLTKFVYLCVNSVLLVLRSVNFKL